MRALVFLALTSMLVNATCLGSCLVEDPRPAQKTQSCHHQGKPEPHICSHSPATAPLPLCSAVPHCEAETIAGEVRQAVVGEDWIACTVDTGPAVRFAAPLRI